MELKFTIFKKFTAVAGEPITPSELIRNNNLTIADDRICKIIDMHQATKPHNYGMFLIKTDDHDLGFGPDLLHCALCKRGFRDATLFELFLCLDAHPDIVEGKSIMASGSVHEEYFPTSQCGGTGIRRFVPVINRCGQLTIVQLHEWHTCNNHFILVVNK